MRLGLPIREAQRGQILVLFTLMLIAFLGMAALAIDASRVFSELRHERAIADAAALAGASDTYRDGSTTVGEPEWRNARTHAMQNLMDALSPTFVAGDTLPTCGGQAPPYNNDIVNCAVAGTPYYVSVYAPATSCVTGGGGCDPIRSVQVTVRHPRFGLTFARIFGQHEWNLAITSVAERNRGTNYSFVTLRPPEPSRRNDPMCSPNCDANDDNIVLSGTNTQLSVLGDMGTNTNMLLTADATVVLSDPGSFVDHYDAYQLWASPPLGRQIPAPIPDPMYPIPARPTDTGLMYPNAGAAHLSAADCATEIAKLPGGYPAIPDPTTAICLKPGLYQYAPGSGSEYASPIDTLIFTPGVYFLDAGFQPGNNMNVIGGYEASQPGVAFVFQRRCSPACTFAGNTVDLLALNAGNAYPNGNVGTPATAAVNWDGTLVQTTGRVPLPMTLIVEKDPACVVGPTDTTACATSSNHNNQLNLAGGGSIHVFGVQYAATDNVSITGGSSGDGFLGQMWAWTVQYTGGSNINLIGAQNPEPGVLRIATACSPLAVCTNPEATVLLP